MPSPFPGMNPYLESPDVWHDFHARFIVSAADQLAAQVRPNYIVKIEANIYLHEWPEERPRLFGRGDANILHVTAVGESQSGSVAAIEAPVVGRIYLAVDEELLSYLEIVDRENREVVSVLELLSPTNKLAGSDREQYLAKRRRLLRSFVHFVEIDLLRGGPRVPVGDLPPCDYLILVSRAQHGPKVQLCPLTLRQSLPIVPVPLRENREAQLDLRTALDRVYDAAGYADFVYQHAPQPALLPADNAWAAALASAH